MTCKLTPTQLRWLQDLVAGRNPWDRMHGMAAHGGAACTSNSLRRRGLIDDEGRIVGAGREALAANPIELGLFVEGANV